MTLKQFHEMYIKKIITNECTARNILLTYHAQTLKVHRFCSANITCSNSTIETLEKGVRNMVKVTDKNTRMTSLTWFWCFYC